jgi:hypothetical protein
MSSHLHNLQTFLSQTCFYILRSLDCRVPAGPADILIGMLRINILAYVQVTYLCTYEMMSFVSCPTMPRTYWVHTYVRTHIRLHVTQLLDLEIS